MAQGQHMGAQMLSGRYRSESLVSFVAFSLLSPAPICTTTGTQPHSTRERRQQGPGMFSQTYGRILTVILHINNEPCCCSLPPAWRPVPAPAALLVPAACSSPHRALRTLDATRGVLMAVARAPALVRNKRCWPLRAHFRWHNASIVMISIPSRNTQ